jgi:hypothetical protein
MRIDGRKNLRTMSKESEGVIFDTNSAWVETKMGKWEIHEEDDGSITVSARSLENGNLARIVVLPGGSNSICVEMR